MDKFPKDANTFRRRGGLKMVAAAVCAGGKTEHCRRK